MTSINLFFHIVQDFHQAKNKRLKIRFNSELFGNQGGKKVMQGAVQ